jgi:hypothetical protein
MAVRVQNTVECFDIFNFAKEKYGIEWNACCDMFHRGSALTYKETNEFEPNIMCEYIDLECELDDEETYDTLKVFNSITDEDVKAEEDDDRKAYLIIVRFMQENNITQLLVLND